MTDLFPHLDEKVPENKHSEINAFLKKKHSVGVSTNTLTKYGYTFRLFFHECHPEVTPAEASINHFETFLDWLDQRFRDKHPEKGRGLKPKTKRTRLDPLSSFYTWAMPRPQYEEIVANPAKVVMREIRTNVPPRPDCATWENGRQIIQNIPDPRNKTVAVIIAKTGCRLNECLELKPEDLLLDEGYIRLRERKGGVQSVIPIDDETVYQIRRYQAMQRYPNHEYLFVSKLRNRLSRQMIQDAVRDAAVRAGVMDEGETRFAHKFTPHTYRTVFTTLMRNEGMSDHVLDAIRGKAKAEMKSRYTNVTREQMREEYLPRIKRLGI